MKKNRTIIMSILMAIFCILFSMNFQADDNIYDEGKCGNQATYILTCDGVLTISGKGMVENTDFGENVKKVVIKEGITGIDAYTFGGMSKMVSIAIPSTVKQIGEYAFEGCTALASVNIPKNVKCIESGVFEGCKNLKSVKLSDNITTISYNAFANCIKLSEINIPSKLCFIGAFAFKNTGLTEVTLPETVHTAESGAFSGCKNLKKIVFKRNNCYIGAYSFAYPSTKIYGYTGSAAEEFAKKNKYTFVKLNGTGSIKESNADKAIKSKIQDNAYVKCDASGNNLQIRDMIFGKYDVGIASGGYNKKLSTYSGRCVEYKGTKYYNIGGKGSNWYYQVQDSKILVKNEYGIILELKLESNGNLKVVYSMVNYGAEGLKKGDILKPYASSDLVRTNQTGTKYEKSVIREKYTITLAKTQVTGNGKAQKPKVTIKYDGKKLSSKYYTVKYTSNKYAGVACATVTGKGNYKSKIQKTKLYYVITPKKMKTPTVKVGVKSMKVSWKTESKVNGYEILLATNSNFKNNVQQCSVASGKKSLNISGLKSKTIYYVKTRAYKTVNGSKIYGSWSSVKKVTVK